MLRIARITQPIFVVAGLSCDDAQCSQRRRTSACCEIGFVSGIWELMGRRAFPLASAYVSLRNHSPGQIGCEDAHVYVASPKAAKHRVRATVGWCFEGGELFPGGELVMFSNCSPWRNKLGCGENLARGRGENSQFAAVRVSLRHRRLSSSAARIAPNNAHIRSTLETSRVEKPSRVAHGAHAKQARRSICKLTRARSIDACLRLAFVRDSLRMPEKSCQPDADRTDGGALAVRL